MMEFVNVFNDREKAIIIWMVLFLIWFLSNKSRRESVGQPLLALVKIVCTPKVGIALLTMALYMSVLVFAAYRLQLWDMSLLKDTIIWFLGSACIMFVHSSEIGSKEHYFREAIVDTVKLVALIEFITNLYVPNLLIELILVPVIVLISGMIAVAGKKQEHAQTKKVLTTSVGVVGLLLLFFALIRIVFDFKDFATVQTAKSFLLSPFLTIVFLPFLYILAVYAIYDALFSRIDFWLKENKELRNFTKRRIFREYTMRLKRLSKFSEEYSGKLMMIKNKTDITSFIQQMKTDRKIRRMLEEENE